MRTLGSSVLAFEIIVAFLFIPAAFQNDEINRSLVLAIFFTITIFAILAMGTIKKTLGIYLGYLTQIILIASGFLVKSMFFLGLVFLGLWILAIRIGRKTDLMKESGKPETSK